MKKKKIKIQERISAVINYPDVESKGLVILCPGYLDTKDYTHLVMLSDDLAEDGFTTVRFNPTGTWESEGLISDYTITNMLKDIEDIIDFMLVEQKYKKIILIGHSRGGFISALYASKDPRISSVVSIMSPATLARNSDKEKIEQWKKDSFRKSSRDLPDKTGNREFVVPYYNLLNEESFDLINDIEKVKVPILFIAGELDKKITPKEVKTLFNKANEPKKFIVMKGIGHDYRHNPEEIKLVDKEVCNFLYI